MDTLTPDHDEAEFGDVIALLRRTYEVRGGDVEAQSRRNDAQAVGARPRRRDARVWLSIAAAAALIAIGAAGIMTLRARDSGPSATTPLAPTSAGSDPQPSTVVVVPGAGDVQWFLPVPADGYHLESLAGIVRPVVPAGDPAAACCGDSGPAAVARPDYDRRERWVRPADPGAATEFVDADTYYDPANDSSMLPTGGGYTPVTIHGFPAVSSSGPHPSVEWVENGNIVTVRASFEMTSADLVAIAEASTVAQGAVSLDPASLPDGFEPVDPRQGVDVEADSHQVVRGLLTRSDGGDGLFIFQVETALMSLDMQIEEETERRVVDGVAYSISRYDDSTDGEFTEVQWVADGWSYEVTGPLTVEEAIGLATTLRPVGADEARAARREMVERHLSRPTLAAGTLADGTPVSVHAPEGWDSTRHVAICIELAEPMCQRDSEGVGGDEAAVIQSFDLGDRRLVVAWDQAISDPVAEGHVPEVVRATSGDGAFLSISLGADEAIPQVTWTDELVRLTGGWPGSWVRP